MSLDVVSHDSSSATLELRTGGFWALHTRGGVAGASGTVRVFVPGLDFPTDARALALPLRRALVDAVVGKKVSLVSAEAMDLREFGGLVPSAVGVAQMSVRRDGTVRPGRRALAARLVSRGYVPESVARLAGTVFQGERKSAVVEITPVRFDGSRQELVLAGRVRVKLAFTGIEAGETGTGSRGRTLPRRGSLLREVLAQVHTSGRGLYGVSFESLFPARPRGFSTSFLRLQRQGEAVSFHVEPAGRVFGPGSVLYFYADRAATSTEYSGEVAYELVRSSGVEMGVELAHPVGAPVASSSTGYASFETNRIYQAGLLEAPDIWLWEVMVSGGTPKTKSFTLSGVDTASADAGRLVVRLQGGSESGVTVDHHVRVSVNGVDVGEATFAGMQPHRLDVLVPAVAATGGVERSRDHERGGHGGVLAGVPGPLRGELPAGGGGSGRSVRGGVERGRDGGGRGCYRLCDRAAVIPRELRSSRATRGRDPGRLVGDVVSEVGRGLRDDGHVGSFRGGGGPAVPGRLP